MNLVPGVDGQRPTNVRREGRSGAGTPGERCQSRGPGSEQLVVLISMAKCRGACVTVVVGSLVGAATAPQRGDWAVGSLLVVGACMTRSSSDRCWSEHVTRGSDASAWVIVPPCVGSRRVSRREGSVMPKTASFMVDVVMLCLALCWFMGRTEVTDDVRRHGGGPMFLGSERLDEIGSKSLAPCI